VRPFVKKPLCLKTAEQSQGNQPRAKSEIIFMSLNGAFVYAAGRGYNEEYESTRCDLKGDFNDKDSYSR
jgi:hypothetical protein